MKEEKVHVKHVLHLRRHRNVLYGVVIILLTLQILTFVSVSSQISSISAQQGVMESDIDKYFTDLNNEIILARQESQFGINELSRELSGEINQQKKDIQSEINLLKSKTQADFSGIIGEVVEGVVSVITDRSAGSGFILREDGYIVTNLHVIEGSAIINVNTFGGNVYTAEIIGTDEFTDLALLKVSGNFDKLILANSNDVQIGEKVIAIGNPLGLSFTVTEGIVSAVDRVGPNGLKAYVQTDVTLNPGNSGGPLINVEGKVIGINNFKIGGAESLGFALESDVVKERVNLMVEGGLI